VTEPAVEAPAEAPVEPVVGPQVDTAAVAIIDQPSSDAAPPQNEDVLMGDIRT